MRAYPKPLIVAGSGAVTPGGSGLDSLQHRHLWPTKQIASIRNKEKNFNVAAISPEAVKQWQKEPRLRRASPISYWMLEASHQALRESTVDKQKIGVIAVFFTGSIVYSRKFYQGVIEQGQKFASPALFPETVFNSPTSHLMASLQLGGPGYSIVGDESAVGEALQVASTWLQLGSAEAVLIVGAEELDPIGVEGYQAAGWLKGNHSFIPSEGAGALLLQHSGDGARISGVSDPIRYRDRSEAMHALKTLWALLEPTDVIFNSSAVPWIDKLARIHDARCGGLAQEPTRHAFTASTVWDLIQAAKQSYLESKRVIVPILGANHQSCLVKIG